MLERVRRALKPATSQVVDLVIALLLFFPESQVLLEKLDDALSIAEVVLLELVNLVESGLKGIVSELTSFCVILKHLIVKDREVECETELDRVAGGKFDSVRLLVSSLGFLLYVFQDGVFRVLSDITIVVTDHFDKEGLGLIGAIGIEDSVVDHVNDFLAIILELFLNLLLVGKKGCVELSVLGVLLNGRDSAACSAFARDQVLESDAEKVALVGVDGATLGLEDLLEEINHILEALSLLSDSGKENLFFDVRSAHLFLFLFFEKFKFD